VAKDEIMYSLFSVRRESQERERRKEDFHLIGKQIGRQFFILGWSRVE
jgi:hypothetical protein